MNATVNNSKMARRYDEEFKRQAVELMIHGWKTQRQVARELDVSEYSLNLWKKQYLGQQPSAEINGQELSPAQMAELIRKQHKEIEYLKRQREILKKAISILGKNRIPVCTIHADTQGQSTVIFGRRICRDPIDARGFATGKN